MQYLTLIITCILLIGCSSKCPNENLINHSDEISSSKDILYDKAFRILDKDDIGRINKCTTYEELLSKFGKPYGTTIPVLTWPKERKDVDYRVDSQDIKWRNGYWFFFEREGGYINKKSNLKYIASFKDKQINNGEAIIYLFQYMNIDWPKEDSGKLLGDVIKIKVY